MYKILTLWQPWATLYAHGLKQIETRPKPTNFRGAYLIHAAQKWSKEQREICFQEPFRSSLIELGYLTYSCQKFNLPLSAIIGAVDIEDCIPIERSHNGINLLCLFYKGNNMGFLSEKEMAFGDYRNGRFAWIGKNHRVLVDPISYKNGQGYYQNFKGDESKLMFK
jgi:hypothetical protein